MRRKENKKKTKRLDVHANPNTLVGRNGQELGFHKKNFGLQYLYVPSIENPDSGWAMMLYIWSKHGHFTSGADKLIKK